MRYIALLCFIISQVINAPSEWTCDEAAYNDGTVCNCDCGIWDPDCDSGLLPLVNCPDSANGCDSSVNESMCIFAEFPPGEWTCDQSLWFDGDGCDCECGAYDADCYYNLPIHRCASHVLYCEYDNGACHYDYPEKWTCGRYDYNDTTSCDCNCGAGDPDCLNTNLPITGCGLHATGCTETGHCLFPDTPPPEWSDDCDADWYGQDGWCDCNCGAYDPDCEDHTKKLYGCGNYPDATWCSYEGHCIEDPYHLWNCDVSLYDDGAVCNCGCGKYDPDCDIDDVVVSGCPPSAVGCALDGTCRYPVPDGWLCPVMNYDSGDGCHCNCGMLDPDCDGNQDNILLIGCAEGAIGCDESGFCEYESDYYDGTLDVVLVALLIAAIPPILVICLVCCCIIFVFIGPAIINIIIIFLCREAKKRRENGTGEEDGTPYAGLDEEEDFEEEELDAVGMGGGRGRGGVGGGGPEFETVEDITGPDFRSQDFEEFGSGGIQEDNFSLQKKKVSKDESEESDEDEVEEDLNSGDIVVKKKELFRKERNDEFDD